MSNLQSQLESIPGFGIATDYFNDYAEEHWNGKDPYTDEETGKKLKLTPGITTKQEQKAWNRIRSQAWKDDKCLLGSCGVGMDCGLGLATFMAFFFPVIGPIITYGIHSRVISIANENFNLPNKLQGKLHSNITFDLLITLPPVIGAFFGWLHGCSTRNAAMIYQFIENMANERASSQGVRYVGNQSDRNLREEHFGHDQGQNMSNVPPRVPPKSYDNYSTKRGFGRSQQNAIEVGNQQQSGFI
ncbi:unnamed protein product [Candida verbasci]|uniref:Uncharacterized protein n=1 Tax=Candida verbasci TaxID=1227364 RepID=A0A9W4X903_9ASCO|nr:unnamed protein product [Candida verbasci]